MDGVITREGEGWQVRFERVFAKPIGKVFGALTTPERLVAWLGAAEIEPRAGGKFVLNFADPPYRMEGEVRDYNPPTLLTFTWPNETGAPMSLVRFQLSTEGASTRLIVTQTFIAQDDLPNVAAGWHEHLERLDLAADGVTTTRWDRDRETALAKHYRGILATS